MKKKNATEMKTPDKKAKEENREKWEDYCKDLSIVLSKRKQKNAVPRLSTYKIAKTAFSKAKIEADKLDCLKDKLDEFSILLSLNAKHLRPEERHALCKAYADKTTINETDVNKEGQDALKRLADNIPDFRDEFELPTYDYSKGTNCFPSFLCEEQLNDNELLKIVRKLFSDRNSTQKIEESIGDLMGSFDFDLYKLSELLFFTYPKGTIEKKSLTILPNALPYSKIANLLFEQMRNDGKSESTINQMTSRLRNMAKENPELFLKMYDETIEREDIKEITDSVKTGTLNKYLIPLLKDIWRPRPLNTILCGPPGTGKTYNTVLYALDILEPGNFWREKGKARDVYQKAIEHYNALKKQKQIDFVTFHQSFSYEEFIEGIKPDIPETKEGDKEKSHHISYVKEPGVFKAFCDNAGKAENKDKKYVFIIDEINRGNISKIFGELITLIEEEKRAGKPEMASVILPYTKDPFAVPDNVYIIGTMNTADRSIALIDTALRRRFTFVEVEPDPKVLESIKISEQFYYKTETEEIKTDTIIIEVAKILEAINRRIEVLIDRDHRIGHAFFTSLLNTEPDLHNLQDIFRRKIIPTLQEYFYDDYEQIRRVLADKIVGSSTVPKKYQFINEVRVKDYVFEAEEVRNSFEINEDAFSSPLSYLKIYSYDKDSFDELSHNWEKRLKDPEGDASGEGEALVDEAASGTESTDATSDTDKAPDLDVTPDGDSLKESTSDTSVGDSEEDGE